jgi:hypothetical protein
MIVSPPPTRGGRDAALVAAERVGGVFPLTSPPTRNSLTVLANFDLPVLGDVKLEGLAMTIPFKKLKDEWMKARLFAPNTNG